MNTYVILLRGINIGRHHKLPMSVLKSLLEHAGYRNVQTGGRSVELTQVFPTGRIDGIQSPSSRSRSPI